MSAEPRRAGSSIDDDTVVGPIRNRPPRSHSRASLAVINPMSPYGFGGTRDASRPVLAGLRRVRSSDVNPEFAKHLSEGDRNGEDSPAT
jgi:hypothetical protein